MAKGIEPIESDLRQLHNAGYRRAWPYIAFGAVGIAIALALLLWVWLRGPYQGSPLAQQEGLPPPQSQTLPPAPAAFAKERRPGPLSTAEERTLKPGDSFKECPECPEMVVVPAGTFMMGSPAEELGRDAIAESPMHPVTIGSPLAAGRFPVTLAQWNACVSDRGCPPVASNGAKSTDKDTSTWFWTQSEGRYEISIGLRSVCEKSGTCRDLGSEHPVVAVSIRSVQTYLTWLSAKTGVQYRLPSEAEREYLTRAGTATPYSTGSKITKDQANFCEAEEPTSLGPGFPPLDRCTGGIEKVMAVGRFQPNAWGLFDLHGNINEYTADCIHPNYVGAPSDGSAWVESCIAEDSIVRGGSFLGRARNIRAAARHFPSQKYGPFSNVGFRVVRAVNKLPE